MLTILTTSQNIYHCEFQTQIFPSSLFALNVQNKTLKNEIPIPDVQPLIQENM